VCLLPLACARLSHPASSPPSTRSMGNSSSNAIVTELCTPVSDPTDDSSYIVRNRACSDELIWKPFPEEPEVDTLVKIVMRAKGKFANNDCLGIRSYEADGKRGPFVFETYSDVTDQVERLSVALRKKFGLGPKAAVGIFSQNRPEWVKTLIATWYNGDFCVPLYDTLGATAVAYILNDSDVTTVFCSKNKLELLFEDAKDISTLKHVVCFDEVTDEIRAKAKDVGVKLHDFKEVIQEIKDDEVSEPVDSTPEDLAYIMYTSGTTGNPKGVRLTHKNILASASGIRSLGIEATPGDYYLSYLPLAHSFETCLTILGLCGGGAVGYFQGDIKKLTDDIATLRPTIFAGVPRVYTRVYDKVMQVISESSWVKRTLFETAFKSQLENVKNGFRNSMWDSLVFSKTAQRLGGRVRIMATGAAPMPAHVMDFLKVAFCCDVMQGYGMTENAAAACVTPAQYHTPGTVGEPLPCCEVKLADVPEMNYTHNDKPNPRGEICLRGHNVFDGYHNLPDKTAEAIDEDGWLHTGDIGQFLPDGAIQIIDRKKNIFKLAQGEYVAAEELENTFKKSKYISQMWIYGNSFHTTLVAVIVPEHDTIMAWCQHNGVSGDFSEAVKDKKVYTLIENSIKEIAKTDKVAGFKVPKDLIIENDVNDDFQGFTVENDCLTPTFKLRRPQLLERYREAIDEIYIKRDGSATKG